MSHTLYKHIDVSVTLAYCILFFQFSGSKNSYLRLFLNIKRHIFGLSSLNSGVSVSHHSTNPRLPSSLNIRSPANIYVYQLRMSVS